MIGRLLSTLALAWLIGFVLFVLMLPRPAPPSRVDGIVVLTGGAQRIRHGLELMEQGQAKRMLVSGVNLTVQRRDFLVQFQVPPRLFDCCIDLGHEAIDTRSNGDETAAWVKKNRYRTIRLITTDWHMRRARLELDQSLPKNVSIQMDAIRSEPELRVLLSEYTKYLLRRIAILIDL